MSSTDAFAAGVATVDAIVAAERANAAIDPRCTPGLRHHGHATERALVLFHGFTNCPRQFALLADRLYEAGMNVYVPRLPRHGMLDKCTTLLADLTIAELTQSAASAVAIAECLGSRTSVLGLSLGATMVAWLAQTRQIDRAVAIAPFFSVAHVPSLLEPVLARTLALVPNVELWWDPRKKTAVGPAHGYPRFPTHALARCLELGAEIHSLARTSAPLAARSVLVLNAKDPAIDNDAARAIWDLWRAHGATLEEYVFENLDARHDIIEPETYPDAAKLVYPVLEELLAR